jgi:hypothetical protein
MAKKSNQEIIGAIVGTILILGFLLGGCVWVMECASGSGMSGMPSSDFCDWLP